MDPTVVDQLVTAAQADAAWAFERLYRHFAPGVYGYLRTQGAEDPEDLTSEVFYGAFRRIRSFTGNGQAFRSWLFTIAHHRLIDDRRRRGRAVLTAPLDHGADTCVGGDVEDDALASLGSVQAVRLLDGLSPDQREVLALRVIADLTVEQTARVLGKQPGAVKALQRRGLAALRKKLEREGVTL
ncbi:MAG: sigma-70 family RNA polymerase sigma factor [Nitriliruptorales bacterium]|nr:sigma-70 family RNA polymerase sigma factor [Nitriliruptorales bacterium]